MRGIPYGAEAQAAFPMFYMALCYFRLFIAYSIDAAADEQGGGEGKAQSRSTLFTALQPLLSRHEKVLVVPKFGGK